MVPDPKIDCLGAPVITLAGQEWFVPPLAIRQTRFVVPALLRVMPALQAMEKAGEGASLHLDETNFAALIDIVHIALTRAYPQLSREEFLDLPIKVQELVGAVATVIKQSGFFAAADAGEAKGEARGETAPDSPAPPTNLMN